MKYCSSVLVVLLGASPVLAAAAEGEGGANPFTGTVYQAIAAAATFLIVYAVLKAKAWGPILKGLQDRENRIKSDLEQAEAASKEASAKLAQYEKRLAEANEEARKVIEQGKADAQRIAQSLRDQAQQEITQMRERAQDQIQAAREQALADIYEQAAVLATEVAGRILQREINADDQRQLVERSLSELSKRN